MSMSGGLWRRAIVWCGWEGVLDSRGAGAGLTRYTEYTLNKKELLFAVAMASGAVYLGFYLFYHSVSLSLAASILGLAAPRWRRQALLERRRSRLKLQFKEALYSLASSLAAGRSMENAFRGALDDMKLLYADSGADMLKEFQIICHRLDNFDPLELALRDLDDRTRIEEMGQFVDALTTCKRSGGDLLEVMKRTTTIIGDKLTVEAEVKVLLAQKRLEARIMMGVPFVFLGFLGFAAPDYMAPLYNGLGYALLTLLFILLMGCFWLMDRIMRIRM
ncbi:type II secretion system F family protein [Paenibacillus sp. PL2-23]|uniref:type II secretion system F family protein n=1 Tax=Paenibacillus sp. PL2-23 TaxID=2100729 RepID=UPI0030F8C6F0